MNNRKNFSSRLKHYITFLTLKQNSINEWNKVISCFAEIEHVTGYKPITLQNFSFGNLVTENYHLFTTRFYPQILLNMHISFQQRKFEIHRIVNPHIQNMYLEIFALELYGQNS